MNLAPPPGKVQAIGVMHLVSGILNVVYFVMACLYVVFSLGFGFFMCCPAVAWLVVGILEIISGAKHLSSNHAGLEPPKGIAIAQICLVMFCSFIPLVVGILTLVFLNDPEVTAWYERKRLEVRT